jgi:Protein of unknown function (DUF3108)
MKYALPARASRALAAGAAAVVFSALPQGPLGTSVSLAENRPQALQGSQISAVYQIALNGFDVGTFHYGSDTSGAAYKLTSEVELSLLMGAFHWKGVSHTSGQASTTGVKPASFGFEYSSSLKSGSVRMGFAKGSVESVSIDPPVPAIPDVVPVKPEHLINVLDPLSAILAITQDTGGKPCDRKVAVFDGKQRFDLQLMYRRQDAIEGSIETASVCRVKYIPIAGYRQSEETANLARTTGIEISFRQVPGAKLFVPQKIVLPTLAGPAEITVQRVDLKMAGSGQIALVND